MSRLPPIRVALGGEAEDRVHVVVQHAELEPLAEFVFVEVALSK